MIQSMFQSVRIVGLSIFSLIILAGPGVVFAQDQNARQSTLNGIVVGIAADKPAFTIVDRSGNMIPVQAVAGTVFQSNRANVGFAEAVRFGMEVRITPANDGSAAQVVARGITTDISVQQLQPFLGATDAEWAVLRPRIERIQQLQRLAEGRGGGGNNGNNGGNNQNNANAANPAANPVQNIQRTLEGQFFDQNVSAGQLSTNLRTLRETRAKLRTDLVAARLSLVDLLTQRQEVLLVVMGILE